MSHRCVKTDDLMWGVYNMLHMDLFQQVSESPAQDIEGARLREYTPPKYALPYNVKCRAQLANWLKRYRFSKDIYSDSELEFQTNLKFEQDQMRIGCYKPLPYRTFLVIQEARRIIKGVLGEYNDEDIYCHCSFSRNSTVGFRGKEVYLDKKIFPGARLTGTEAECRWFKNYLRDDTLLRRALQTEERITPSLIRRRVTYEVVSSLKQVNVPKTAKILRPVRPNTLIGSFRSIGIGRHITALIKEHLGINLNYLQEVHQRLARTHSRRLTLVTADLSSASDSFTPQLLNMLLPRSWYNALKLGRTPYVEIGDSLKWSPSFMAMGIGYTFPTMTLCFFAILRAIQRLSRTHGKVSVFGDDLIYPCSIHHYVVGVFNDINFRLNMDKTFTVIPFRESCGGDFYDSIDVRPARPEGVSEVLEGDAISAYVYKLFNSLIRRWEVDELPLTFAFLRSYVPSPHHVPNHFPDESGFKDGLWRSTAIKEPWSDNRRKPFYWGLLVPCLVERGTMRPVGCMDIFYWESLQRPIGDSDPFTVEKQTVRENIWSHKREVLVWRKAKRRVLTKGGKSYRKLVAFQSCRGTRFIQPGLTLHNR